jgi:hypothetical protein
MDPERLLQVHNSQSLDHNLSQLNSIHTQIRVNAAIH